MGILSILVPFDDLLTQGLFLEEASKINLTDLPSWRRSTRAFPKQRLAFDPGSQDENELALNSDLLVPSNVPIAPTFPPQSLGFQGFVTNAVSPAIGSFLKGEGAPFSGQLLAAEVGSPVVANEGTSGLKFNFQAFPKTPQAVLDGFVEAGNIWSALLAEPITLDINVRFIDLGSGILGATVSNFALPTYSAVREALILDQQSRDDNLAVSSLPIDSIAILTNHVLETLGTASSFLDNGISFNNTRLALTTGNAKALGLNSPGVLGAKDGTVTLNSSVNWDFDRSDGIDPGAFDFVGVVVHEIGHALGFFTTVDAHDTIANTNLDWLLPADFIPPTVMDMYRFSEQSRDLGALDHQLGTQDKYFSIDGGLTPLASFSTGTYLGNGEQASHWQDDLGLGIMDPTFDLGELGQVSALDLQMLDVIGWDLTLA